MGTKKSSKAVIYAIGSAALYALYPPLAKFLINDCPPAYLSAFLYLGTGIGTAIIMLLFNRKSFHSENNLRVADIPSMVSVIIFNIIASFLMNVGVMLTSSSNIALLGNFEIVATSLIAFIFFHERIGKLTTIAITIITASSFLLSVNDFSHFSLSIGSIVAIVATVAWGLENNLTSALANRNPLQIVMIKGFGVGIGSLLVAIVMKEKAPNLATIWWSLCLGFVAYGVNIIFYIIAQRYIGAARTSAYYAVAPFISVLISVAMFGAQFTLSFIVALILMIIGTVVLTKAE